MKRTTPIAVLSGLASSLLVSVAMAREAGFSDYPIHQGRFVTSVLYEHFSLEDSFDGRGDVNSRGHLAGTQVSWGITDRWALALKGGALIEPVAESQGTKWLSRAGYLYGLDLSNEVFPATRGGLGLRLQAGIVDFIVPLDRVESGGMTSSVDQRISGLDYHLSVVGSTKLDWVSPYAGIRVFGRSVDWRDNRPAAGAPASIHGHADGNLSFIVGLPVRVSRDIGFQVEGLFLNQTTVTAGMTIAPF